MTPNARRSRGRPPALVKGADGRVIPNLSATPYKYKVDEDGAPLLDRTGRKQVDRWRYFVTGTKPPKWLGFDLDTAVTRLRKWEARNRNHAVVGRQKYEKPGQTVSETAVETCEKRMSPANLVNDDRPGIAGEEIVQLTDLAKAFRAVMNDPRRLKQFCALLPEFPLDRLQALPDAEPARTLTEIGEFYLIEKRISTQWRRKAARMWNEFTESVGVRLVREITLEHIRRYKRQVLGARSDNATPVSPAYISHRFGNVKTIFKYALDNGYGYCQPQIRVVLDYCGILAKPGAKTPDPRPISPQDYAALLRFAETKWRAVLLCALNFCMYPGEVAALNRSDLQLDKGTLVTQRSTTKVTRIAVLWPRTAEYVRKYLEAFPHDAEPLFLSHRAARYVTNHIGRNFRNIRKRAGLQDDLKFEHIRDGAYSAAVEQMSPQEGHDIPANARLLAGHRVGMADHYVKRRPTMVKAACEAIWRHYGEAIEEALETGSPAVTL